MLDRSPTLRKSCSEALGYCCKIAPNNTISKAIARVLAFYTEAEADSDTGRIIAGSAMCDIIRHAGERARGFAIDVVPVAFVAMHDEQAAVSTPWTEVWQELARGNESGATLYCAEIVKYILRLFSLNNWHLKVSYLSDFFT
jgi:hypothetical protein